MYLVLIPPKASSGGGGSSVDIGPGDSQVPTNLITAGKVQAKLDTYPILGKTVGTAGSHLTDNDRVIDLIGGELDPVVQEVVNINQSLSSVTQTVQNIVNNPPVTRPYHEAVCTESLQEGMYIKVFRDGLITRCSRADGVNGLLADGFVLLDYAVGATVKYYDSGENEKGNELPAGKIYLSDVTPGRAMSIPPAARSRHYLQVLGESIGLNKHLFKPGLSIQLL